MPEIPDPRPHYERAADQLVEIIRAVRRDQLDAPTPCTEFTVRDLLGHLVLVTRGSANLAEGAPPLDGPPGSIEVPGDAWVDAYTAARSKMTAAWADDAKLDDDFRVPWGISSGRVTLSACVLDTVVHAWDITRALGERGQLDEAPAEFVLGMVDALAPAERRGPPVPFAPVQPAPADAGPYERLAAFLGRAVKRAAPDSATARRPSNGAGE